MGNADRESSLLVAMSAYMARFNRPGVNLIEAMGTRKSTSQIALETAMYPWRHPESHRPSSTLSHLRAMGYSGNEDTLELDVRSLERRGLLLWSVHGYHYRPADET